MDPISHLNNLSTGFRFHPTDNELMLDYLCTKIAGNEFPNQIIGDIDLYKFDAWVLPDKALFGDREWYFFTLRDRENGSRPNRVSGSGYWKVTGTDKVLTAAGRVIGMKKALVFYVGGEKTNWIMHEYRALNSSTTNLDMLMMDEWMLCRIHKKNSSLGRRRNSEPNLLTFGLDSALRLFPEMNSSNSVEDVMVEPMLAGEYFGSDELGWSGLIDGPIEFDQAKMHVTSDGSGPSGTSGSG